MNEWTTKRLDALHEGTSVAIWDGGSIFTKDTAGDPDRPWAYSRGGRESSAGLIRESRHPDTGQGWVRVVSAPIDALLNPKQPANFGLGSIDPTSTGALMVVRAAIAHVTGEAL